MVKGETLLRAGVVGVGYVGKRHAEKYVASAKAQLVGVVDILPDRSRQVGENLDVTSLTYYLDLF